MTRRFGLAVLALMLSTVAALAQPRDVASQIEPALRSAFAALFALPMDTSAAEMDSWVLDTARTRSLPEERQWTVVVTRLTDTGRALHLRDQMAKYGDAITPAQMAAAAREMQRLEGEISKAEAEAALEISVVLEDAPFPAPPALPDAQDVAIAVARHARRSAGKWVKTLDREFEIEYDRWSAGQLLVVIEPAPNAAHRLVVRAVGNDGMIARVIKETHWAALAAALAR